jgi:serine protease Do
VRSWMGVEIREVDDVIAKQFGLPSKEGALVNNVVPGSPADKSGLKRGDVILKFNGTKVTDAGSLQDMVTGTAPKTKVSVEIIRAGKPATFTLVTEELPGNEGKGTAPGAKGNSSGPKWLGATFGEVTSGLLEKYGQGHTTAQGVIATDVPPASDAAAAGLEEGDIVRGVNRKEVKGLSDFEKALKGADVKEGVVLDIVRKGESLFLSYKSL